MHLLRCSNLLFKSRQILVDGSSIEDANALERAVCSTIPVRVCQHIEVDVDAHLQANWVGSAMASERHGEQIRQALSADESLLSRTGVLGHTLDAERARFERCKYADDERAEQHNVRRRKTRARRQPTGSRTQRDADRRDEMRAAEGDVEESEPDRITRDWANLGDAKSRREDGRKKHLVGGTRPWKWGGCEASSRRLGSPELLGRALGWRR
jgi:hypothetical protein